MQANEVRMYGSWARTGSVSWFTKKIDCFEERFEQEATHNLAGGEAGGRTTMLRPWVRTPIEIEAVVMFCEAKRNSA